MEIRGQGVNVQVQQAATSLVAAALQLVPEGQYMLLPQSTAPEGALLAYKDQPCCTERAARAFPATANSAGMTLAETALTSARTMDEVYILAIVWSLESERKSV